MVASSAVVIDAVDAESSLPTEPQPLDILLTNDDGWRGEGGSQTPLVVVVRDALEAAGHDVVVVAPGTDQSGQGARLTGPPTQLELLNPEPDVWTLTPGSPADSIFFAIDEIFGDDPPDLVISGMNPGHNVTSAVIHSGTVNAALTAGELEIPSLAMSIERRPDWPAGTVAASTAAAAYVVDLVAELQASRTDEPLMPADVGLNVNYPVVPGAIDPATGLPREALDPGGSRATTLGTGPFVALDYQPAGGQGGGQPGFYDVGIGFVPRDDPRGTDARAIQDGYVSITALEADHDVGPSTVDWLRHLTRALSDLAAA